MNTELEAALVNARRVYGEPHLVDPVTSLRVALRGVLVALSTPPADDVREALEAIWDDGNATGLDGWVGPGRGASPIDPEAVEARRRAIEKHGTAVEVRPHGTVTDAEVLRAKAAALTEFADAVRMPFTVFRGENEEPITPGDLMRETAARYLAEAAREVHQP